MKEARYLACSRNGMAFLNSMVFSDWEVGGDGVHKTTSGEVVLAVVQIKTKAAP